MHTSQNNTEYMCKLNGSVFKHPCTVTSCFSHISNLTQSKVKPVSITNCAHADFALHGFSENLDYAVEEQGFVGYRDLQYISPYLNTSAQELREIYTENVASFKRALAILWNAKDNNSHFCRNCGHPLRDTSKITCTSPTICNDRLQAVEVIAFDCLNATEHQHHASIFNVIWRSLTENFTTPIALTNIERSILNDLRTS